jgi:hypothetical protein
MAVFGANTADLSDRRQISAQIGGLTENGGNVFQFNAATNTVDAFRYVFLYCLTAYMRKGVYEYRVLAVSGDDEAYSVSSRCEFTPKRGLTIKIN